MHWIAPTALLVAAATFQEDSSTQPDCYDLKVIARPIAQVPSISPECDGCIVMRWPWFIDLKVTRVVDGAIKDAIIPALSLQHTYRQPRRSTWWLRRNAAGGLNVVGLGDDAALARCAPRIDPAPPFIRAGLGETLEQLRADGERRYGRHGN